ncbi:MAG: hypothetical protein AB7H43_10005 [Acidimicrobiia bacterium]
MTGVAAKVGQAITATMLAASGGYLIVYLYRWEWNRALVAGCFFVATEVALLGTLLLRRLASIEQRLDRIEDRATLPTIRRTAPPASPPFQWLDESSTRLQVFVPVLLGAGVIMSLLAFAVERLAMVTSRPLLERDLARRLDDVQLPRHGLLAAEPDPVPRPVHRPARVARVGATAFTVLAGAVLTVTAADLVADATQDRSDPPLAGGTEISLSIERRFTVRSSEATAEALFVACRHTIGHAHGLDALTGGDDGLVHLTFSPAIGKHATRRFVGCMEDAQFDRILADVVSVRRVE